MKRRTVLETISAAGVVGSTMLSGCLGSVGSSGTGYRWTYDGVGELDVVKEGTVFGRKGDDHSRMESAFALDATTGEVQWTYGGTGFPGDYRELAVEDGVYFGDCGDDDCYDLYALDQDGEERWVLEDVNPGHERPHVADGFVYVGNVQAYDAETGEEQWTRDFGSYSPIVDITDVVYVQFDDLIALDRGDGSTRWRYDPGAADDQAIRETAILDGVAYVVTRNQVASIADGDELWRGDLEEDRIGPDTEISGIASDRLVVFAEDAQTEDFRLYAFDVTTGERDWVSDPIEHPNVEYRPQVDLQDDVVYVGTDRLRALNAATGEERWSETVDAGPVQSVSVVEEGVEGDHAVFVHADETQLASFDPTGELTWEDSVNGDIWNYLVNELAFVATDAGIYALDY